MRTIQVDRKEFIKTLNGIKEDNVSIADIAINRKNLVEALKLQTQDGSEYLTLTYGKVSWQGKKETPYETKEVVVDNEPCIQFNCNHTTMRFLNRPTAKRSIDDIQIIPLNFSLHNRELTGIPIDTIKLLSAINKVSHCMATEESRPALRAMLFDLTQDNIKVVSADGFRLGISEFESIGITENKILIDKDDIERLVKFLRAIQPTGKGRNKEYPDVYFTDNETTVKFASNHGSISLPKKDGNFPNYQQLIPTTGYHMRFIASELLQSCKALSKTCRDGSGIVRLYFEKYPNKLTLKARSEEIADTVSECQAIVDREQYIACNINYLMQYLKTCKDNIIDLFISNSSSPMSFYDTEKHCEIIMPMFVQW